MKGKTTLGCSGVVVLHDVLVVVSAKSVEIVRSVGILFF